MSSKYELTLKKNYVSDWDQFDAYREFFQNGIDQGDFSVRYIPDKERIVLTNKNATLEKNSLLLGGSSKSKGDNNIGQFGEGYKIALLVLTRLGRNVTIYNYSVDEVWTSRFVNSRRYGAEILTIFVDRINANYIKNELSIVIDNVTEDDYSEIVERTLILQDGIKRLESSRGDVLLNEKYAGKLFVNGLFVTDNTDLKYGYDIKPSFINIGRDRNLVDTYDIKKQTAFIWRQHDSDLLQKLILNRVPDIQYIHNAYESSYSNYIFNVNNEQKNEVKEIADKTYEKLREEYGLDEDSILVVTTSDSDRQFMERRYENAKVVTVDSSMKSLMEESYEYCADKNNLVERKLSLPDQWSIWLKNYSYQLGCNAERDLKYIVESLLELI